MNYDGPINPMFPSNMALWNGGIIAVIILFAIWSVVWKGFALYRAGANRSPAWFVCLLIFNTLGILEILYLFVFGKKKAVETPVYQVPPTA